MRGAERRASGKLTPALGLLIAAGAFAVFSGAWDPARAVRIGFGFAALFVLPGWLLGERLIPGGRYSRLEQLALALPLTLGIFAYPALLAFAFNWPLERVLVVFFVMLAALLLAAVLRALDPPAAETAGDSRRLDWVSGAVVMVILAGLSTLAYFLQAFRGLTLDWDYFNYISQVRKLAEIGSASNLHFAYLDAPPDPIHSYNLWALLWALVSRFGRVDPIELYLNAAFLTVPLAALAFFALARRFLDGSAALAAFLIYAAYHVIYGGMAILGATTFFPEDSMWLLAFPGLVLMTVDYLEHGERGVGLGAALAAVGIAVVHVMWGLAFYLTVGCFFLGYLALRGDLWGSLVGFFRRGPRWQAAVLAGLVGAPPALAGWWIFRLAGQDDPNYYQPLFASFPGDSLPVYGVLFLALPLALLFWWVRPLEHGRAVFAARSAGEPPVLRRSLLLVGGALAVALPYMAVRYQAVQVTQWQSFGRNPYRAFFTPELFFLNPLRLSWNDPNLTFYPLYLVGLLGLPWLLKEARSRTTAVLAVSAIAGVLAVAWYAPLSTLFARFFSLGYLRRILRLGAVFSLLPAGLLAARVLRPLGSLDKRRGLFVGGAAAAAAGLALLAVPWPAKPVYYNQLWEKMVTVLRNAPRDSLLYDDAPFRRLKERKLIGPGEVVFSDVFTSYRLTAYLNNYVAVQQKPGTGVADQDRRRLDEFEFFQAATTPERMRALLDRYQAGVVLVNRDPSYQIYNYSCGHPETVGKLRQDPRHFQLLFDEAPWVAFRYRRD